MYQIELDQAIEFVSNNHTPFFVFDLAKAKEEYRRFLRSFPNAAIYYAVKANNHPTLLASLRDAGARFEVGSWEEIDLLLQLGVSSKDIIFSAPVKIPAHISRAYAVGVDTYAFDSITELEKLSQFAPGARVLVRLRVANQGSLFPLNSKFGVSREEGLELLYKSLQFGLIPFGVAFHVGSQCTCIDSWSFALEEALLLWTDGSDLPLTLLDIGGGFPVTYSQPVISIENIADVVLKHFDLFPDHTQLLIEPGRSVVATSGKLVATVIGKATRGKKKWLYLDVGALHGLFESLQSGLNMPYPIRLLQNTDKKNRSLEKYVVSGPTCDPDDTILKESYLLEPEVGDRVIFSNVGAYSLVYATEFMSLPRPSVYFVLNEKGGGEYDIYQERVGTGYRAEATRGAG